MSSFRRSYEEIEREMSGKRETEVSGAKILIAFWETKKAIVEGVIPAPLVPADIPLGISFIASFDGTSAGVPYNESALVQRVSYKGELGSYYLGMHVTDDRSAFAGREYCGFPKKVADIRLDRKEDMVRGWTERLGTRCIEIEASMDGSFNERDALASLESVGFLPDKDRLAVTFLFKHFFNPERTDFDFPPTLVRQQTRFTVHKVEMGKASIQLDSSHHDPWGEIEIVRPLGALYIEADFTMFPGKSVCEVDAREFLPYAFAKWDWHQ